jgi:thiamine transport system substrate-binding protein
MKRTIVAVLALVVVGAACGSSAKTSGPQSTSANKPPSKTVTLLTHDAFAASKSVLADFTKQTGFKIKLVQSGDAGRVVNEAILRKDHPVADAVYGIDNSFLSRALDGGILDPYTPKGSDTIPTALWLDPQHRVTPVDTGDVCINYDNTWFGHDGRPPAPTGFASLTDPRYKNLTVVESAATSSPGLAFLIATMSAQPGQSWQDYWRALKSNGVRVVNDWTEAYETDFTAGGGPGDRPIVVSYASSPPADVVYSEPHHDTPRVGVVDSTCIRQIEFAGVLHNASNPVGAQALVDFLVSRRFQADMPLQMYVNPVQPGTPLPAVYKKWASQPAHPLTIDPAQVAAHRDEWIKEWNDIAVR